MAFDSTISPTRAWAYRIGRVVMLTMFVMLPVHFYFHRWETSDIIAALAYALLLPVAVLSIIARRFSPFGWALLAVLLHSLSAFA
jgi:hypothetical protein